MADSILDFNVPKLDTRPQYENRLIFEFPSTQGGVITSRVCPFFENPKISESQQANLVTYDVLGRAGNFFGYTGAKSRAYNLEFDLTLPHIVNTAAESLFTQPPTPLSREQKKEGFFNQEGTANLRMNSLTLTYTKMRQDLLIMLNNGDQLPPGTEEAGDFISGGGDPTTIPVGSTEYRLAENLGAYSKGQLYAQAVQMLLFWIKLIRVSVSNNQMHPTFGPPIIRVKMGALFDYISCLATKYSLSWDEMAGYDPVTLLPNRIKIKLSLVQIQRNPGTDRTYNPKELLDAQNRSNEVLGGWEEFEDSAGWADWLTRESPPMRIISGGST